MSHDLVRTGPMMPWGPPVDAVERAVAPTGLPPTVQLLLEGAADTPGAQVFIGTDPSRFVISRRVLMHGYRGDRGEPLVITYPDGSGLLVPYTRTAAIDQVQVERVVAQLLGAPTARLVVDHVRPAVLSPTLQEVRWVWRVSP